MQSPQRTRVLIADADSASLRSISSALQKHGHDPSTASNSDETLLLFRTGDPHAILLSANLPGIGSSKTLERIRQARPTVPVIFVAGENDTDLLFQMSKLGADDYLQKPFDAGDLENKLARLLDRQKPDAGGLREQVRGNHDFTMLFGTSPKMEEVKMTIEQVAETNATVLIRGESGTGKEVVARMIHENSLRTERPFVKVNCAAIPNELLESELFGYEPGAFTGAHRQKLGKFDLANKGTIFLDEISEMHPALQAKLLHVLQDGEFSRLGGKRDIGVDVRVLAATNKPLERNVAEGVFREDLFYRLNVVTVHIPPLRERIEEIPVFLEFFFQKYCEYYGKQPARFSDYALQRMMEYAWPGNIRELENLVKRYVILGSEEVISNDLQPRENDFIASDINLDGPISLKKLTRQATRALERKIILKVLHNHHWNRKQAAKTLNISYRALLYKIRDAGLPPNRARRPPDAINTQVAAD